jgi:hypothetical protein
VGQLDTETEALEVQVLGREVVLLGRRVSIALSVDAAAETARRLAEAVAIAQTNEQLPPRAGPALSLQASQTLSRDE